MTDVLKATGCDGKIRYATSGESALVLASVRRKGRPVKPYHCDFCGGWHLGNPKLRGGEKAREKRARAIRFEGGKF